MLGDLGHEQPDSESAAGNGPRSTRKRTAAVKLPGQAAETPRTVYPLAAKWGSVYRSGAGHPRQAATSPERDSEALQARGPHELVTCRSVGVPGRQSTPVDCVVDESGYEGPRIR
jgi:hypothetical protein